MKLNEIRDNEGAYKNRIRVGRGIGSGKGKTGGRGVKGQKSRSGVAIKGFEGGQMPIYQRLPKRGFNNIFRKKWVEVNLGRIQQAADNGRLDISKPISRADLQAAGLVSAREGNLRLLAKGEFKAKLDITVTGASKSAIALVEKLGGKVNLVEATPAVKPDALQKKPKATKPKTDAKASAKPVAKAKAAPKTATGASATATPKEAGAKPATAKPAATKKAPAKKPASTTKKTTDKKAD